MLTDLESYSCTTQQLNIKGFFDPVSLRSTDDVEKLMIQEQ